MHAEMCYDQGISKRESGLFLTPVLNFWWGDLKILGPRRSLMGETCKKIRLKPKLPT